MKIRFLLLTVDHLAGTERAAVTQANALAARGHDVEIISILRMASTPRLDIDPGVHLRYLTGGTGLVSRIRRRVSRDREFAELPSTLVPAWWDPTLNARCDLGLERHLPRLDADVVVTMTHGLLVAAAQLLPRRCALVHQEHRSSMHRTIGIEPLLAFAPRADAVASLTEVNAAWLREQLGPLAPPIHVMPNAAPAPGQPRSLLDQPVIMAAGRLDSGKQYDHLIRAFAQIADELPEWRIRIFGTGSRRRSLMSNARRLSLHDRVELPGVTSDLAAEWAGASIAALTSQREGFPLVLLEAMAAGLPVVSYDCPTGPGELIEHGVNGFLVPLDDETALAAGMLRLARDPELRARMGQAGFESLQSFDPEALTERWEQIYAQAIARRREGHARIRVREAATGRPQEHTAVQAATARPRLVTPAESRRDLLLRCAELVCSVEGWFTLPARGETPPTLVVPGDLRREVLDRFATGDLPADTSIAVSEDDHWQPRRGTVPEMAGTLRSTMASGFAVEPWPEIGGRPGHLAHASGIRVEFWSRDRHGDLVAQKPNAFATRVADADIQPDVLVEDVLVWGLATLPGPYADQCNFPVDVVYTWVDNADPLWQKAWGHWLNEAAESRHDRTSSGAARFRNRDELRYSMRGIHAHAPWVRTIHIVTAGQRPDWLKDHPRVRVVDHREILPTDALPTFNSHAIEAALNHIPGLSEHFVYFNDDVFLARPMAPERFFSPGGLFAIFPSIGPVGLEGRDDRVFVKAAYNNRRLLRQRFGATSTHRMAHSPHPHRRSVLDAVSRDFAEAITHTMRARFRSPDDVSMTASLAQHYGLLRGDAYVGDIDLAFVDTSKPNMRGRLRRLGDRDHDAFCLGDSHDYAMPVEQVEQLLREFLDEYFPVPGPWES